MKKAVLWSLLLVPLIFLPACKEDDVEPTPDKSSQQLFGTGWDSNEPYAQTIPVALNYGNYQSSGTLPARVDLTSKFPPVREQRLSTCVGYAVGYNTKSYLDAVAKNLSVAQLQSTDNQYSPTDLFFSIDPSKRACDSGTQFDDAFNILITRGVNTYSAVPDDGRCYQYSSGSASAAAKNKIKNFRRISGSTNEVKQYLAQGVPVVFGAMVNEQFWRWRGSGVISTATLDYTGKKSGHAMVIAGYDDAKRAFRIVNSWGLIWGENGYAWVDYDFLVNTFCVQGGGKSLFVAFNDNPTTVVSPTTTTTAPDLTALVASDYTMYPSLSPFPNARRTFFDVRNMGNQTISAASNWNIYYLWVDAFNANNYGVIFRGEFTTAVPLNTYQNLTANYTRLNYNLAPGASLGQVTAGKPYVSWDYFMPPLSGNYYLVLYIDKGNSNEANQTNNVFYVTQTPKFFTNGYSARPGEGLVTSHKYKFDNLLAFRHELASYELDNEANLSSYRKLSNQDFPNSYTSDEVVSFLEGKIKNGGL